MKKVFLNTLLIILFLPSCKKSPTSLQTSEALISPVDFLTDFKFFSLNIDMVYDKGYSPSSQTIDYMKKFLGERLRKSKGIFINLSEIDASGKDNLSLSDITEIERKNRTYYSKGSTLSCFIYLTNSGYADDAKMLGLNYASTSIVLFGKTIRNFSGGTGQANYYTLEATAVSHELAHVIGLVNKGTGMTYAHIDAAHGKHCFNANCLTHYLMETTDIATSLKSGNIPELDSNCIKDLRKNGGK